MIRHIVVWKLKAEDDAGKAAARMAHHVQRGARRCAQNLGFDPNEYFPEIRDRVEQ